MITLKGFKTEYPLPFAIERNGKSKLGYSKGGYPLNQNGMPTNKYGINPLKFKH